MSLFVLEAVLSMFRIRGQIRQNDGFPDTRGGSPSFAANRGPLLRVLAAAIWDA